MPFQNQISIISEANERAEQTKQNATARANQFMADAKAQAQQMVNQAQQQAQEPQPTLALPTAPTAPQMKAVEVDGHLCVGYVSIPLLKLELPVLAECTDANLKISPCLFTGTTMEDDLTIAGHNYRRHFGPIRRLKPGNDIIFVDMDGNAIHYQVAAVDAVPPTAVEEVTSGQFDLALITCTYGGKTRLVVYCDRQ